MKNYQASPEKPQLPKTPHKKQQTKTNPPTLKQTKLKKRMLFNKTKKYNIETFIKIFFFKYRTRQIKTIETNKLLILIFDCFTVR